MPSGSVTVALLHVGFGEHPRLQRACWGELDVTSSPVGVLALVVCAGGWPSLPASLDRLGCDRGLNGSCAAVFQLLSGWPRPFWKVNSAFKLFVRSRPGLRSC